MRKCIFLVLLGYLFLFSFLSVQPAIAGVSWLLPTENVGCATDLSIAPDGAVYIAESMAGRIQVFDRNGKYRTAFPADHPSAIAVDSAGRLYVGRGRYSTMMPPYNVPGEVKIYESRGRELVYIASLGSGSGEFVNPTDIYVDRAGNIYVADSDAHNVKIFTGDGNRVRIIGQYGKGDGYLNRPLAVTVDEPGNIYITDKQLIADSTSGDVSGARVQVFSAEGVYMRGFGRYLPGELISPSDIAVHDGLAYIADSFQNAVLVYDATSGVMADILQAPDGMLRVPVSLGISGDGLLYVAAAHTGRLYRAGAGNFANMTIEPGSLEFQATAGGAAPPAQAVTVGNTGNDLLGWTAETDRPWIIVDTQAGEVGPGMSNAVHVGVDQSALSVGTHTGTVLFRSAGGAVEVVSLIIIVKPRTVLKVGPQELQFEMKDGVVPPSQAIKVEISGGVLHTRWNAVADSSWLVVNPVEAGTETTEAMVGIVGNALVPGEYHGTVSVESAGAIGSPAAVAVTLRIKETGSITVQTNHDDATYTVRGDNGTSYEGSGRTWSVQGVAAGTYHIEFHAVAGYRPPATESKTLDRGGHIEFAGEYRIMLQRLATSKKDGTSGTVRILDASGSVLHAFTGFGDLEGDQDIALGDLDGDGEKEIVVSMMKGGSRISIFSVQGGELAGVQAFSSESGVSVETGDVDGDGAAEILALDRSGTTMKIFQYAGGMLEDTGGSVSLDGVKMLACGDVDGDGTEEVITADPGERTAIQIWHIVHDADGWTAQSAGKMRIPMRASAIGTMHVDGSEAVKLLTVDRGGRTYVLDRDGKVQKMLLSVQEVCDIDSGDVDGDGVPEIIAGTNSGWIKIIGLDGKVRSDFRISNLKSCIRLSIGEVAGY